MLEAGECLRAVNRARDLRAAEHCVGVATLWLGVGFCGCSSLASRRSGGPWLAVLFFGGGWAPWILGATAIRGRCAVVDARCPGARTTARGVVGGGGVPRVPGAVACSGLGVDTACVWPLGNLSGGMASGLSWACAVGAASGSRPRGRGGAGELIACRTMALAGTVA